MWTSFQPVKREPSPLFFEESESLAWPQNHRCCLLAICGGCLPPFMQSLAMPLFNKKFESKPIPVRQGRCNTGHPVATEDLDDFRQISLTLGNKELRFADGIWMHSSRKGDVDDMLRLNRKFRALEEENNMCNLKIEVMLDLLAEHATELNELKPKEK